MNLVGDKRNPTHGTIIRMQLGISYLDIYTNACVIRPLVYNMILFRLYYTQRSTNCFRRLKKRNSGGIFLKRFATQVIQAHGTNFKQLYMRRRLRTREWKDSQRTLWKNKFILLIHFALFFYILQFFYYFIFRNITLSTERTIHTSYILQRLSSKDYFQLVEFSYKIFRMTSHSVE